MKPGELTLGERVRLAGHALWIAARETPRALRGPRSHVHREMIARPDTALCARADAIAQSQLSPGVYRHSRRCWEWAVAFVDLDALDADAEALFVACILHDVALGAPDGGVGCFAVAGAEQAARLCEECGSAETGVVAAEAIACHFHPSPGSGAEQRALHAAAHLDVVGYRAAEMNRGHVLSVLDSYPRTGFRREFVAAVRAEARVRPRSVAATMYRAGMALPAVCNPLDRVTD